MYPPLKNQHPPSYYLDPFDTKDLTDFVNPRYYKVRESNVAGFETWFSLHNLTK